ncbi:MAG: DUF1841 family protein [Bordetella sp.]|nr:MAG: DUF1841 family protein [Bordetella sp.]
MDHYSSNYVYQNPYLHLSTHLTISKQLFIE